MGAVFAWVGVILGIVAKILMAKHRMVAVWILLAATILSAAWAFIIRDWQSVALHIASVILMIRTIYYWTKESKERDSQCTRIFVRFHTLFARLSMILRNSSKRVVDTLKKCMPRL